MGCKSSKKKLNKDAERQKMCKIGLSLGRNELKVEGNFQIGYHSKTDKKYTEVDGICEISTEPNSQLVSQPTHNHLPTIEEDG